MNFLANPVLPCQHCNPCRIIRDGLYLFLKYETILSPGGTVHLRVKPTDDVGQRNAGGLGPGLSHSRLTPRLMAAFCLSQLVLGFLTLASSRSPIMG